MKYTTPSTLSENMQQLHDLENLVGKTLSFCVMMVKLNGLLVRTIHGQTALKAAF